MFKQLAITQSEFLDALDGLRCPKAKGLLQTNLPNVLADATLPNSIKALLKNRVSNMFNILCAMMERKPNTLLLDKSGDPFFPKYEAASNGLRADLLQRNDSAGVTFLGRNLKLFSWCQAELKETAHPVVGYLLEKMSSDRKTAEGDCGPKAPFNKLADICNTLILQIACGDDIADNIQNDVLVPVFVRIPFSDKVRSQKGLPSREDDLACVAAHNNGIYSEYYKVAVDIWDDCVCQLKTLFGDTWDTVEPGFLALHEKVMGSLTYSILMNTEFNNPEITDETILENLAPNMMVECFRFLEKSLAQKIADENKIGLPAADLEICDDIVAQSQKSASLANATATAPREMRENDISNPIPFALNRMVMRNLEGKELSDEFEAFLKANNHFFAQYELEDGKPPKGFNCLDLLLLRKVAMRRIIETLGALFSRGLDIPEKDYSLGGLAVEAIKKVASSKNRMHQHDGKTLEKLTQHIQLIDKFFEDKLIETNVEEASFKNWEGRISGMKDVADTVADESLKRHAQKYVSSWEDFLCMYLLFKRAHDGTI